MSSKKLYITLGVAVTAVVGFLAWYLLSGRNQYEGTVSNDSIEEIAKFIKNKNIPNQLNDEKTKNVLICLGSALSLKAADYEKLMKESNNATKSAESANTGTTTETSAGDAAEESESNKPTKAEKKVDNKEELEKIMKNIANLRNKVFAKTADLEKDSKELSDFLSVVSDLSGTTVNMEQTMVDFLAKHKTEIKDHMHSLYKLGHKKELVDEIAKNEYECQGKKYNIYEVVFGNVAKIVKLI